MNRLSRPTDLSRLSDELERILDLVIAFGDPVADAELLHDVAAWSQLAGALERIKESKRDECAAIAASQKEIAISMAFVPGDASAWLRRFEVIPILIKECPEAATPEWAEAAAAACVADQPVLLPPGTLPALFIAKPEWTTEVFKYWVAEQAHLSFDPQTLPFEVQAFMVPRYLDSDSREWAAAQMKPERFADIVYSATPFNADPKKSLAGLKDLTLRQLAEVGGPGIIRAGVAAEVCRHAGIPSAVVAMRERNCTHRYIGRLVRDGNDVRWDFSTGRFAQAECVSGRVAGPCESWSASESDVAATTALVGVSRNDRRFAAGLVLCGQRIRIQRTASAQLKAEKRPQPPGWPSRWGTPPRQPRSIELDAELAFYAAALDRVSGHPGAWQAIRTTLGERNSPQQFTPAWVKRAIDDLAARQPLFLFDLLDDILKYNPPEAKERSWEAVVRATRKSSPAIAGRAAIMRVKAIPSDHRRDPQREIFRQFAKEDSFLAEFVAGLCTSANDSEHIRLAREAWDKVGPEPKAATPELLPWTDRHIVGGQLIRLLVPSGAAAEARKVRRQLGLPEE